MDINEMTSLKDCKKYANELEYAVEYFVNEMKRMKMDIHDWVEDPDFLPVADLLIDLNLW